MSAIAAAPDEALIDKVIAGERITQEDARALYRLPLNELGELANIRRTAQQSRDYIVSKIGWPKNVVQR